MTIHCIGIGGVAVAALAAIYKEKGYQVQGSDASESEITQTIQGKGIKVFIGHNPEHISSNVDKVVFSEAIPRDNPELKKARKLGLKCQPAAQAIADLSRQYFTIAVSGMHGKTTTCCMIAEGMSKAGLDPSFIIGTKNGGHLGKSQYLVIEADDYQAKFLNYEPNILVLTNIDKEHLDYFKDLRHIKQAFSKYVQQVQELIIANKDDKYIKQVVTKAHCPVRYYTACNLRLKVPGRFNQYNAAAALEVLKALGIAETKAKHYLRQYQGTWRRFQEYKITLNGKKVSLIIDYGHHPTEIKATMEATRNKFPNKKIWLVFQPHQYQRTFYLKDRFVAVFKESLRNKICDNLIITDIYAVAGREDKKLKQKINAQGLAKAVASPSAWYVAYGKVKDFLKTKVRAGQVVVMMGAGDIYELSTDWLKNRP